jgi:mycothiol synthase
VPTPPDISGLTTRPWRSADDWAHIARLVSTSVRSYGLEVHVTAEEVAGWLANADDIDPPADIHLVEMDGHPVGYTSAAVYEDSEGRTVYRHMCRMEPAWRGKGIGTYLFDWVTDRLTRRHMGPGVLQTDTDNDEEPLTTMLLERGYAAVQHMAELVRPHLDEIPDRPLPDGLEIRPVEDAHLRAIFDADREAFADHWGTKTPTKGDWQAFLDFAHRDESMWKVAWAGDRIAGQVRGYVNREENEQFDRRRGWCEFISTARDWRGKGVASALICETLREFSARGLEDAALGVHVENATGAFSLYTGLGFELESSGTVYEKPVD